MKHGGIQTALDKNNLEGSCFPFPHFSIENFIENKETVCRLREEIVSLFGSEETHEETQNDLSSRMQSCDLSSVCEEGCLKDIRNLFYSEEMISFVESSSETSLSRTEIDLFCQVYRRGDYLLCHDDMVHGRAVAFLLYLVDEEWTEEDGGTLDLYSTDEELNPEKIVARIVPKHNQFAFFTISPKSFHQVSEVVMKNTVMPRISIIGWYHRGPTKAPEENQLSNFLSPVYGEYEAVLAKNIDIEPALLGGFLSETAVAGLKEFLSLRAKWTPAKIPPNQGSFSTVSLEEHSPLFSLLEFLSSDGFRRKVSVLSGVEIEDPVSRIARRYSRGDYELYNEKTEDIDGLSLIIRIVESRDTGGEIGFMASAGGCVFESCFCEAVDNVCVLSLTKNRKTLKYIRLSSSTVIYHIGAVYKIKNKV
ncbi:MAG: 2-oxoglutarate and iron-dependent oxygenase domain-containing protein 1 [Amphiamblys sp. WSBS2006]|nr:MAG: 2-oxoglutarate and iron-dependent oxygenase domain-containing protein 1 [Amphiamblys sp. WSBS2006]